MRSSNLELPSAAELMDILAQESQRKAVKFDFLQKFNFFEAYKRLADQANASIRWVDDYVNMDTDEVSKQAEKTARTLAAYIQQNPDADYTDLFNNLSIGTKPQKADLIFVFGSPADARIKKAVELYDMNYAERLVVTGHSPVWSREHVPEAIRMQRYALEHGVAGEAIMLEPESITLPDNVKRTLDDFEKQNYQPKRILIVASTFILRRAYMEWYKFTPWDIEIIAVTPDEQDLSDNLRHDTWFKSEKGIWMLLNEYAKIIIEHKMDLMREQQ